MREGGLLNDPVYTKDLQQNTVKQRYNVSYVTDRNPVGIKIKPTVAWGVFSDFIKSQVKSQNGPVQHIEANI